MSERRLIPAGREADKQHSPMRPQGSDHPRMVTGTPGPDSTGEPADRSLVEPDATVRDSGSGHAADVAETVQRDLSGPALELLEHVRARTEREREGSPDGASRPARSTPRRSTRRPGSGSRVSRRPPCIDSDDVTRVVHDHATRRDVDDEVPGGDRGSGALLVDPAACDRSAARAAVPAATIRTPRAQGASCARR